MPAASVMVISVTASTTQGKRLEEDELARANDACDMIITLCETSTKMFDYVESRMSFMAPNLTHICGK